MDPYLEPGSSLIRLIDEYQKYKSITIAYDFDDTVYDFHKKGRTYNIIIKLLQDLKSINCYLVCWTGNQDHEFVKDYLNNNRVPFDSINENPPFYKSESRKVYANAYLDDRAGLVQVATELRILIDLIKKENV